MTVPTISLPINPPNLSPSTWKQFQPQTDITAYELAQIVPYINGSIMVSPQQYGSIMVSPRQWAALSPTLQRHFVDAPPLQFYPADQNGVMVIKG